MDFQFLRRAREMSARHLTNDLAAFTRAAWPTLHPGSKLHWNWHLDLLCEYLTLVRLRKIRRLIINVPPRTAKTSVASICFPVWDWISQPAETFLCCSYELDLATTHNLERRRLIASPWFQGLFADRFRLSADRSLAEEFTNESGGAMLAASVGSRSQGRGGSIIVVDDPISAEAAYSDVTRKGVNDWFQFQLPQRLNDPATSPIVLIQQRLHESDPTGYLLANEAAEWIHVKLPLVAEEDEEWIFPISGRVVRRRKGEVLDSKRFPARVVAEKQRNRLAYSGQYQQEPAPIEGNLIRRSDVRYYGGTDPLTGKRDEELPVSFDQTILSVDCSFKDLATSDFVAIAVIGISGRKRFIRNVVNAHLDAAATEVEIRRQHDLYSPVSGTLIEDKANGSAVIQRLKTHVAGVIEIQPEGGKIGRMYVASAEWQSGDWYVDRNAAWTEAFLQQITMFPNAKNDDMADTMSQAAIWLQANSFVYGVLDWAAGGGQERTLVAIAAKVVNTVRDVWGHVIGNPRDQNLDRAKLYPMEALMRGLDPGQVQENMSGQGKWKEPPSPSCPKCKSATTRLNNFYRCQQCGNQEWVEGQEPSVIFATRDGGFVERKMRNEN